MASLNDNVGRVSSRVGADSGYTDRDDSERQLNNLKSTYQRMRAILILCGSLSAMMGLMMLSFAIYRRQILNDEIASETFSLIWIHGASNKYSYELHYFPIHALGATSRAILSLADVEWKERVQPFETWKEDKSSTPFGSLPILTVRDSQSDDTIIHRIPEADVIERYLAKEFGFFGSTKEEELQISIFLSQTITIHNVWVFRVVPALEPVRDSVLTTFLDVSLKNWVQNCERHLAINGSNGHFVGEKTSLADIKTAVLLDMFLAVDTSEKYLSESKSPELWRLKKLIDSHPRYSEYRRSQMFITQDELTKKKVVPNLEPFDLSRAHVFA
ncbi:hypothetical protein BGZ49_000161 [Haplosporangium sp. Z 27]|nr:hypothetical protein BGZ49_000161 [Haplosporangium sp. Z 27]